MTITNAKRTALDLIERLPDDVTMEDIMYELYVRQKIERGLEDVRQGRTMSHAEVVRQIHQGLA